MAIKKQHWPAKQNLQLLDFFLLIMPFTFLFYTFDVNGGALLFLAKYVTRNWTDWQDTQAVLFLLTLPSISSFVPLWAKYVTKIAQVDGTHRLCQARDIIWLYCCFYRNIFFFIHFLRLCVLFCKTLQFNVCLCLRSSNFVH